MSQFSLYGGKDRVPGVSVERNTFENEFIFGTYYRQERVGFTIDGSSRDTGNTGNTNILRAGLVLGLNTATKKLVPWNPAATDGSEYPYGILKESRVMSNNNQDLDRMSGPIFVAGGLLAKRIIIPGSTTPGIVGNANEFLLRNLLNPRFLFDDAIPQDLNTFVIHTVTPAEQGSGITLTNEDTNRAYHSDGDVTITLPANAYKGLSYRFYGDGATITVASGSSNIVVPGSPATNSLAVLDVYYELIGDGTNWIVLQL